MIIKSPFRFVVLTTLSLFMLLTAVLPLTSNNPVAEQVSQQISDPELTVTATSSTSVLLEWDAWGDLGSYQVTVKNLNTLIVEQSFSTSSLSASVSNLSTGVTYRFSVEKNGFVIAEDIIL